jgi:hypothetical protein
MVRSAHHKNYNNFSEQFIMGRGPTRKSRKSMVGAVRELPLRELF